MDTVNVGDKPSEELNTEKKSGYNFWKRFFDIVLSVIAINILAVPILIISLIIIIDSPGASPIFVQERVGLGGKKFRFYKFRTMIPNADQKLGELLHKNEMEGPAFKIKNDPRITKVGRFLRKTSLDEIPQFWNVLRGSMSLVGPRPPLPREVAQYTEHQHKRLAVIPGITCYWQIQPQRNSLTFDEWVELDLKYIREKSIKTDAKILFKTVGAVCGMEGE